MATNRALQLQKLREDAKASGKTLTGSEENAALAGTLSGTTSSAPTAPGDRRLPDSAPRTLPKVTVDTPEAGANMKNALALAANEANRQGATDDLNNRFKDLGLQGLDGAMSANTFSMVVDNFEKSRRSAVTQVLDASKVQLDAEEERRKMEQENRRFALNLFVSNDALPSMSADALTTFETQLNLPGGSLLHLQNLQQKKIDMQKRKDDAGIAQIDQQIAESKANISYKNKQANYEFGGSSDGMGSMSLWGRAPTQNYGDTSVYGGDNPLLPNGKKGTPGVDIPGAYGEPVPSNISGEIVSAKYDGGYGLSVVVKDGGGNLHRYSHLSATDVKPGDTISVGDLLGAIGNTGNVYTGGHPVTEEERASGKGSHLDYRVNNGQLDPNLFMSQTLTEGQTSDSEKIARSLRALYPPGKGKNPNSQYNAALQSIQKDYLRNGDIDEAKTVIRNGVVTKMTAQPKAEVTVGDKSLEQLQSIIPIIETMKDDQFGFGKETMNWIADFTGSRDQQLANVMSIVGEAQSALRNARFGSALTGGEIALSDQYMANFNKDGRTTTINKLKSLVNTIQQNNRVLINQGAGLESSDEFFDPSNYIPYDTKSIFETAGISLDDQKAAISAELDGGANTQAASLDDIKALQQQMNTPGVSGVQGKEGIPTF